MKIQCLAILLLYAWGPFLLADQSESKQWTNVDGRSFIGSFVSAGLSEVKILKNQDAHTIPLRDLCEDDQTYVFRKLGYKPYAIGNMEGGAFAGKIRCYWKMEGRKLIVHAFDWKVRFLCHDQPGRELKDVYLWLGNNELSRNWGTVIKSKPIHLNRYIAKGEIADLGGLSFELELYEVDPSDHQFLVMTYETGTERRGFNFDMPEQYLFTGKPLTFSHLE